MRSDLVVFGDDVDDLHRDVAEGGQERLIHWRARRAMVGV